MADRGTARTGRLNDGLAIIALAFAAVVLAYQRFGLTSYIGPDFRTFRGAAARLLSDPATLYIEPFMKRPDEAGQLLVGFLYPPPSALLFVPLAYGDRATAFYAFGLVILAAAIIALLLWGRLLARDEHAPPPIAMAALCAMALVAGPIAENWLGQVDTILLLICVAAIVCLRSDRPVAGGALIALGCWVKIYPVLLLIDLALQPRARRAITSFSITAMAIPALSLLVLPMSLFADYFTVLLPAMSGRTIVNIDNQSLMAVAGRTGVSLRQALDTYQAVPVSTLWRALITGTGLAGIAAIGWRVRRCPGLIPVAWVLATIPLIAPLGWGHSYAYAMPLWILVAANAWARRARFAGVAAVAILIALLPTAHHRLPIGTDPLPALWMLAYARYAVATLAIMALAWWQSPRAARRVA